MLAAWKASAGFVRIMICFHLISALPPKLQTTRLISGPQAIRCGWVLSNEIKLDHSFHLRNLDGISRQARMACVATTAPALFSLTPAYQAGVQPALISTKPFQRLNSMSRGEPPARRAMLIGAQLIARSKGATTMLAIFPLNQD